ncbi:MAG: transposase [Acidimicrobiia bacterium]
MNRHPSTRHRRTLRLKGYDYAQAGAYFVTICTQNRLCLLGQIEEGQMWLSAAGQMVQRVWDEIPMFYPGIEIDAFVVMPNHVHGIIVLTGLRAAPRGLPDETTVRAAPRGRPIDGQARGPDGQARGPDGQARGPAPTGALSLPDVVHRFKTLTTKRYADGVKQCGWPAFPGRLWQRNYYERIIRDERALAHVREYIANNPRQYERQLDGDIPSE